MNDVLSKKIELIQWISALEDESLIGRIEELRKKEVEDWGLSILNDEKLSLEKGIIQAKNGELLPHSTARKLYEKWI